MKGLSVNKRYKARTLLERRAHDSSRSSTRRRAGGLEIQHVRLVQDQVVKSIAELPLLISSSSAAPEAKESQIYILHNLAALLNQGEAAKVWRRGLLCCNENFISP